MQEKNKIQPQQRMLIREYLEYHGSTHIRPIKIVWYKTENGTELPYFLVRHIDEGNRRLSGIYSIHKDRNMKDYVSEEECFLEKDEPNMVKYFLNDMNYEEV